MFDVNHASISVTFAFILKRSVCRFPHRIKSAYVDNECTVRTIPMVVSHKHVYSLCWIKGHLAKGYCLTKYMEGGGRGIGQDKNKIYIRKERTKKKNALGDMIIFRLFQGNWLWKSFNVKFQDKGERSPIILSLIRAVKISTSPQLSLLTSPSYPSHTGKMFPTDCTIPCV